MKLSLLIPAYNEAVRLPPYLRAIRDHFSHAALNYEVIVVDDGSTDGMYIALNEEFGDWPQLRIVEHLQNQGRGQAIRTGNGAADGDLVLFADADGATPIGEETKLRAAIEQGAAIAIGSRVILNERVSRIRAAHRAVISKAFAILVHLLLKVPARDTQCGFKMWRREVGEHVLAFCQNRHWLLDVELLAVAQHLGYPVAEVPVTWTEIPGSKVHLLVDSIRMFGGLWRIRRLIRKMKAGSQLFETTLALKEEAMPRA